MLWYFRSCFCLLLSYSDCLWPCCECNNICMFLAKFLYVKVFVFAMNWLNYIHIVDVGEYKCSSTVPKWPISRLYLRRFSLWAAAWWTNECNWTSSTNAKESKSRSCRRHQAKNMTATTTLLMVVLVVVRLLANRQFPILVKERQ